MRYDEKILKPWSEADAYKYYKQTLTNGLYTVEHLKETLESYRKNHASWEEADKRDAFGKRDYESYMNACKALERLIKEEEDK